ncbi:hypothetical protein [Pseudomaricurvus sp. HS19]|uniref:hypothetical protein n=1 Tax=Pseudomaricurvus sp. HS19 TaxID=2692626 RepID=UPI001368936E|nr:hypothetical protein [Pseudomaricurvus sp. HS19]MYM64893.1 hypothetical protein [Pseudomaricurvus sp. HS19]
MQPKAIPIRSTILTAINMAVENRTQLLRLALPLLVVVAFSQIYNHIAASNPDYSFNFISILFSFAYLLTLLNATVGAHRVFLLSRENAAQTRAVRWTMRETRFLGWWIVLSICITAIISPLAFFSFAIVPDISGAFLFDNPFLGILTSSLIFLPAGYVFSRWAMVLPATAIDQTHKSLGWAWDLTKGHSLRLFFLICVIPLTTDILLSYIPFGNHLAGQLCYQAIWLIVGAIEICLLSLSFGMLNAWASDDPETTEEQVNIQE